VPVAIHISLLRFSLRRPSPCTPSPFTAALRSAAHHPSLPRPSLPRPSLPPLIPLPFTPALHSAALHPSFRRSSPLIPASFTPALHCAPFHPSFRRSLPFTPALHSTSLRPSPRRPLLLHFTPLPIATALRSAALPRNTPPLTPHFPTVYCDPSLRRPSPFIPPPSTLYFGAPYPSLPYRLFTLPPFTRHVAAPLQSRILHSCPSFFHPSPFIPPLLTPHSPALCTPPPFTPALHYAAHQA
jgi:hypothetical protein